MSLDEVVLEGTLKPDGTLELDQKPSLSPGRVRVILQPASAGPPHQRGLADVIDEIRQGQQARGIQGRSAEEIEAGLHEGEEEYERRMPNPFPTPEELAAEAREALRRHPPKQGREKFQELVRKGFINAQGQVTCLIGGSAEPEPNYKNWVAPDRKKPRKTK